MPSRLRGCCSRRWQPVAKAGGVSRGPGLALSSSTIQQSNSSSHPLWSSFSFTQSPMLMCCQPVSCATSAAVVVFPVPGVPVMRTLGIAGAAISPLSVSGCVPLVSCDGSDSSVRKSLTVQDLEEQKRPGILWGDSVMMRAGMRVVFWRGCPWPLTFFSVSWSRSRCFQFVSIASPRYKVSSTSYCLPVLAAPSQQGRADDARSWLPSAPKRVPIRVRTLILVRVRASVQSVSQRLVLYSYWYGKFRVFNLLPASRQTLILHPCDRRTA